MEITWHGQSCFTVKAKEGTIAIDPFKNIGLKEPKIKADVCLVTHDHNDHNNIALVEGINSRKPVVISGPGEYEVSGINIIGVKSKHDENEAKDTLNTIYVFKAEDIFVCHLGDLGQKSLSDSQLESLNGIDVLMVPVGGTYTIDGKEAAEVVNQIDPRIVIPMHYKIDGLNIDLDGVDSFAKSEGASPSNAKDILKVSQMNLPTDDREVVILKAK